MKEIHSSIHRDREAVLCVDLDGTLLRGDLLYESFVRFLACQPWNFWRIPIWLASGKARLKRELSKRVTLDPALLPYHQELMAYLREARKAGRTLVLATASDRALVEPIVRHVGLFDDFLASDGETNLAGDAKRRALVAAYGEKGFDYAGNDHRDLKVWPSARKAIVVSSHRRFLEQVRRSWDLDCTFSAGADGLRPFAWGSRASKWLQNGAALFPVLFAFPLHREQIVGSLLTYTVFCLCSTGLSVFDDLMDLDIDRSHWVRKTRPFAAGQLSLLHAMALAPTLWIAGLALSCLLPWPAVALLAGFTAVGMGHALMRRNGVGPLAIAGFAAVALLYWFRLAAGVAGGETAFPPGLAGLLALGLAAVETWVRARSPEAQEPAALVDGEARDPGKR